MALVVGLAAPRSAGAALTREIDYAGTITGTVFGQAFQLPVSLAFAPPLPGEQNPLTLAMGTPNVDASLTPGYLFMTSASRIPPPFALTIKQIALSVAGNTLTGTVVDTGAGTTAVNGNQFSAPNVCDIVEGAQAPLLCVYDTSPAEQFYFLQGTTVVLQVNGAAVTGQVRGPGNGLVQILPYPPVIYDAALTATLTKGSPLDLQSDLASSSQPAVIDRTAPSLSGLRATARRSGSSLATIRVDVSEPGIVAVGVEQLVTGLALGPPLGSGSCRAVSVSARRTLSRRLNSELAGLHGAARRRREATLRARAACARAIDRGAFEAKATKAGAVTLSVPRRLKQRTLGSGRYRFTVVAVDAAGNQSAPRRTTITIHRR